MTLGHGFRGPVLFVLMVAPLLSSPYFSAAQTALSPVELVRRTVQNEIKATNDNAKYMFKDVKQTATGTETKLLVETCDATAGLLIAVNGKALPVQQRQQEIARVENYIKNPDELRKKQKQEREDAEHVTRIMKALPEAFLYEPDGTEIGQDGLGHAGDDLIRLRFRPNPAYVPPTHTEQVLTGMSGFILIDENRERIAKIDGVLKKEVGFGWGILGHLDKGGHFIVQQSDVGDNHWEVSRMDLAFTGKILFLKKLNIRSSEVFSDFRPAPSDLTFAQGVELLKKQEAEIAQK